MKKSLHFALCSPPAPLAFPWCCARPDPQHQHWPIALPRPAAPTDHGQDPMLSSPKYPRPGAMPWAPGQAAEVLTWFSWPYQKAPAACARLQLRGWERLAWPTEPNLSPKGLAHSQGLKTPGAQRNIQGGCVFLRKRWQQGGG